MCLFILGNAFCERLAFYGLSTNLVIYLTKVMGEDNRMAAMQVGGLCRDSPCFLKEKVRMKTGVLQAMPCWLLCAGARAPTPATAIALTEERCSCCSPCPRCRSTCWRGRAT